MALLKRARARMNSWVMLSPTDGFVPLEHEQKVYTSPSRVALSLKTRKGSPAEEFSISSSSGRVYLTNQRVVYLPSSPNPQLHSFFAGLLDFKDSYVVAPWFGANYWSAVLTPRPRGGIPPGIAELELKMEFKEGGSFDFHTLFVRLKELAFQQAEVEAMRASEAGGELGEMNMPAVNLEQLPAYEASPGQGSTAVPGPPFSDVQGATEGGSAGAAEGSSSGQAQDGANGPPAEPPPGYEEVQRESVAYELERSLRQGHRESGST